MTSALQQSSPASWSQGLGRERGAGQDPLRFMTDYKAPERNPITQDSCAAWLWLQRMDGQGECGTAAEPTANTQALTQRTTSPGGGPLATGSIICSSPHRAWYHYAVPTPMHSASAQTHPLNPLCQTYFPTWIYMRWTNCSICLISRNLMVIKFQPAIVVEREQEREQEREMQAESRAWKEREKAAVF